MSTYNAWSSNIMTYTTPTWDFEYSATDRKPKRAERDTAEYLELQLAATRKRLARVRARDMAIARFGDDPYDPGNVISWQHHHGHREYTYVALKVTESTWYTTSRDDTVLSWADLVDFIASSDGQLPTVFEVTQWAEARFGAS